MWSLALIAILVLPIILFALPFEVGFAKRNKKRITLDQTKRFLMRP